MDTLLPRTYKPKGAKLVKFGVLNDYSEEEWKAQKNPAIIQDACIIMQRMEENNNIIKYIRKRIKRMNIRNKQAKAGLIKGDLDYDKIIKDQDRRLNEHISLRRRLEARLHRILKANDAIQNPQEAQSKED
ncbi:MAG TPA: hypothetical protein DEP47_14300 [Chloroflexi bacterium]|nr:hypothetical protein [Chloroflexota bacterium]